MRLISDTINRAKAEKICVRRISSFLSLCLISITKNSSCATRDMRGEKCDSHFSVLTAPRMVYERCKAAVCHSGCKYFIRFCLILRNWRGGALFI